VSAACKSGRSPPFNKKANWGDGTMKRISRRTVLRGAAIGAASASIRIARADEPIKLGASLSLTGRFSDSAKYAQEGYQLWEQQTNAAGGINGRPVSLIIYDDASNPDTGRVLVQRLIDRDGVLAVLGPYSSPITDAEAVVVERAEVPLLGPIASDSSIWTRRKLHWSFQAFPSSDYDHVGFLDIFKAKAAGAKKLAIIFEQSPFSIASKDFAEKTAAAMGLSAETFGYSPGAQDFRSIIERMVSSGTEVVSMGGYYEPSVALTRQMIERGFNPLAYHFIQAADGVTKDALGANAEGIFGRSAWEASVETPTIKAFVAAYQAKFNRLPSYHSAATYSAGEVIAAAIKAAGVERKAIRDYIAVNSIETVFGTFRVNETGQQTGYKYVATQWQGGVSRVVGGSSSQPIEWPKPKWT
jgi:branched-chain amino acid transport system substrate-binding protein